MKDENNKFRFAGPVIVSALVLIALHANEGIKQDVRDKVLSIFSPEVLVIFGALFGVTALLSLLPLTRIPREDSEETVIKALFQGTFFLCLLALCVSIA